MTINPNDLANSATLTFHDDFNSLSLWNGTSGTWATDFWYDPLTGNGNTLDANGEQEWYINSNDPATKAIKPWAASNGILTITGAKASAATQSLINGYKYTSGEINTYHSFSQEYGYFEMRAQLPAGQGTWPAFWLLPEDGSWPPEIDIMEVLGNDPTMLYTSTHSEQNGKEVDAGPGTKVANMSTGYHTYGADWEADYITFYFDGKEVWKTPTPPDMHKPMYIEANLALGGYWPGNVNSSFTSAQMKIDYIRAYTEKPSTSGSGSGSTTPGKTYTANNTSGQVLTGTSGNDKFYAGHDSVIMTGGAGADDFIFQYQPWNAGQIKDFTPGTDKIDIHSMLSAAHYTGTNPFGDGTLTLASDGHGGTDLMYHPKVTSGTAIPITVVDIDNVVASKLSTTRDFITTTTTTATTATTPTTPTTKTPTTTTTGKAFHANDTAGQVLTGTAGNDKFYAGHDSVVMTGHAGADMFVFQYEPWNAGHVTDFTPGTDKIDLSGLFKSAGYTGTDPFHDGTLSLGSDEKGGTNLVYHPSAKSGDHIPITIVDLDHVSSSSLHLTSDFLFH